MKDLANFVTDQAYDQSQKQRVGLELVNVSLEISRTFHPSFFAVLRRFWELHNNFNMRETNDVARRLGFGLACPKCSTEPQTH